MPRLVLICTAAGCLGIVGALGASFAAASAQDPSARPASPATEATTYSVDPVHSGLIFKIGHLGVSSFYGRFNRVSGSYVHAEDPAGCRFELEVKTDSIDTNNDGRDGHLKSAEFFSAEEFPVIRFQSTEVAGAGPNRYQISGTLTLRGVSRPIQADVKWGGARDAGGMFGYRSGFEAAFTIKRTEFGMGTYVQEGMLGDEVHIIAFIEGKRQ